MICIFHSFLRCALEECIVYGAELGSVYVPLHGMLSVARFGNPFGAKNISVNWIGNVSRDLVQAMMDKCASNSIMNATGQRVWRRSCVWLVLVVCLS